MHNSKSPLTTPNVKLNNTFKFDSLGPDKKISIIPQTEIGKKTSQPLLTTFSSISII